MEKLVSSEREPFDVQGVLWGAVSNLLPERSYGDRSVQRLGK